MVDNKIMIAVPTAEMARRADFYDYFNMLEKPLGSIIVFSHGQSPAQNRNLMIRAALEQKCSHILFLDDDVAFEKDLLYRLLAHDKDMVTGLYFMRTYPHYPIIFDYTDAEGKCGHHYLSDNETGLIEVVSAGLGCCLIGINVFLRLKDPWIRLGELEPDNWSDDIGFFRRARAAGFKLYCDLDARVGHMAQLTVWPSLVDGKWMTTYDTHGTGSASIYQITRKPAEVEDDSRVSQ